MNRFAASICCLLLSIALAFGYTKPSNPSSAVALGSARNPNEPYVTGSNSAWRLRNPGASTLRFNLIDPVGKTLLATSLLEPGTDVAIPTIGSAVIVRFPESLDAKDIYLPFSK